ncbi:sulfatase-like hydrolase/transferase [Limibacter armeniacum]|uniref:sulfatase-like hydrolase/transferase n=1 Tax=Limibacter armeniacum TaxID=466084 RepID=UPI002FE65B24
MKKHTNILLLLSMLVGGMFSTQQSMAQKGKNISDKPNVIILYMDDLGFGDLSCYGSKAIKTPNIDKIAKQGIRFTNGYATSSTCTPSRYALLTGEYPWKNKDAQILSGDAPLLIGTEKMTLPKKLKANGYTTAVVGKWHLGVGNGQVNWNERVSPGPNEVGFEYAYIMGATNDRVPTVYLEDGNVVGLDLNDPIEVSYKKNFEGEPTGLDNPELLKMKWHHGHNQSIVNGIPRIGYMKGGKSAHWDDENMSEHFLNIAQDFVKQNKEKPFFLYYALHQPHVPRVPNPKFVGSTDLGPRGDVIVEADWTIGQFMKTLKEEGLLENTLIFFSSDNGPVLNDGYFDQSDIRNGLHTPTGGLRGGKYSLYDAGTHVPFLCMWKGTIKPMESDALVSQLDIFNSVNALLKLDQEATDSKNTLDAFMGTSQKGRETYVVEAGRSLAYRSGDWLMIPPYEGNPVNAQVGIELGRAKHFQLYNLKEDPAQEQNLSEKHPEILAKMKKDYLKEVKGFEPKSFNELTLH